jgi:hypothetical protein
LVSGDSADRRSAGTRPQRVPCDSQATPGNRHRFEPTQQADRIVQRYPRFGHHGQDQLARWSGLLRSAVRIDAEVLKLSPSTPKKPALPPLSTSAPLGPSRIASNHRNVLPAWSGRLGWFMPKIPRMPIQAFVTILPIVSMERVVPAVRGVTATGHLDCVLPVRLSFV